MKESLNFFKNIRFQTQASDETTIVFFNNQGTKLELYPIEELTKDINNSNPPKINQTDFS